MQQVGMPLEVCIKLRVEVLVKELCNSSFYKPVNFVFVCTRHFYVSFLLTATAEYIASKMSCFNCGMSMWSIYPTDGNITRVSIANSGNSQMFSYVFKLNVIIYMFCPMLSSPLFGCCQLLLLASRGTKLSMLMLILLLLQVIWLLSCSCPPFTFAVE